MDRTKQLTKFVEQRIQLQNEDFFEPMAKNKVSKFSLLTLLVRRYLVPTPSTGGGVEPTPYDLKNGRPYKLHLWQAIRTINERQKTGGVDDLSLVGFP